MILPEKITILLGPLAEPMAVRIKQTGESQSVYLRRLIAEDCGVESPSLPVGNPWSSDDARRAIERRWVLERHKAKAKAEAKTRRRK